MVHLGPPHGQRRTGSWSTSPDAQGALAHCHVSASGQPCSRVTETPASGPRRMRTIVVHPGAGWLGSRGSASTSTRCGGSCTTRGLRVLRASTRCGVSRPRPRRPTTGRVHLEYRDRTSNKLWEAHLSGSELTVRFGRIGTSGQVKTRSFVSPAAAARERDTLVASKLNKGYRSTRGGTRPSRRSRYA